MKTPKQKPPPVIVGPLLTQQQAADALCLSVHTIRSWTAQRRILYIRLGRAIRIPQSEIDRLLTENFIPAKEEPR